jgi:type I restriction enzyme S subunit
MLSTAGRWDIDFHLPAELIREFPKECCVPVRDVADIIKTKRDPTKHPERPFRYVDIASVDVVTGSISNPQDLTGEEAPSRARKVIHAYDIIVSTCRPTRGAIAVVPEHLHGAICSTGFAVIRCKAETNPFYLHFALRLPSTVEQFRKWSTGSSYPAILDEDVGKTIIPIPSVELQDRIAELVRTATAKRDALVEQANQEWTSSIGRVVGALKARSGELDNVVYEGERPVARLADIRKRIESLPAVEEETNGSELESLLLDKKDAPP